MCSIISLEVSKECTSAKDISHKINSATPSPVVKASEVGELKQVMLEVKDLLQKLVNKQSLKLLSSPATCTSSSSGSCTEFTPKQPITKVVPKNIRVRKLCYQF